MLTGNRHTLWQTRTDHIIAAPPLVTSDLVITCGVDQSSRESIGFVDAWDKRTGEHRWSYTGDDGNGVSHGIAGVPVVADDRICFADGRGVVRCLEAGSGKEVWRYASEKPVHTGQAIAAGQVLLGGDDGRLVALDLSTGK